MTCDVKYLLFRPCRWEAQYDTDGSADELIELLQNLTSDSYDDNDNDNETQLALANMLLEKLPYIKRTKTYVCSVCTACGKTISRPEA